MEPEWMGPTYNTLRRNCCTFTRELAIELGVGSIPKWVYSLAKAGAKVDDKLKGMEQSKQQRLLEREKGKAEGSNDNSNRKWRSVCSLSTRDSKGGLDGDTGKPLVELAIPDGLADMRDDQDGDLDSDWDVDWNDSDYLEIMGSSSSDEEVVTRVRTDLSTYRLYSS